MSKSTQSLATTSEQSPGLSVPSGSADWTAYRRIDGYRRACIEVYGPRLNEYQKGVRQGLECAMSIMKPHKVDMSKREP